MESNYWLQAQRRIGRRRVLAGASSAGVGLAALGLVGCGDDDDTDAGPGGESTVANTPPAAGVAGSPTASAETPKKGGTLRLGTFLDVLGVDPHIEVSIGLTQAAKVYTFLGGFRSRDQKFVPIAASNVEQPDSTTYTFALRKDIKWANKEPVNGRQLTAKDVLYSLERFRDHPKAQNNDFFKTVVDSMKVIDEYTFQIKTKAPYAEGLSEIGGIQKAIVAQEEVDKKGDLSAGGVGAGAYIFESYEKGRGTTLVRNPDYFIKEKPYPDKITWQVILDLATLFQAYKAGQHDIYGGLLTKLDYDELKRDDKLNNSEIPALHYGSLALNVATKPFDDPRVREAIYLAIDRKQVIDKVFQGAARRMGPLNPGLDFWALPDKELDPYATADKTKSKQLLAAAGFPDGFDMEIDTSNGVQIYIDHLEIIVPELKSVGINVTPKITDLTTYLNTKLFNAGFQQATVFTHNPYESPKIPLGFYHTKGLGNGSWWHYSNPTIDAAIDKQGQELDITKRKELVLEAQRLLLKDFAPLINMAAPTLFNSWRKTVGGYDPQNRGFQPFTLDEFLKS